MPSRIRWQDRSPAEQPSSSGEAPRPAANLPIPAVQTDQPRPPTPLLDAIGRDLTRLAQEGRLVEVYGRQAELRQVMRLLLRKQKNNPLIVGAPGVGKTALVEGLAQQIARRAAPAELQTTRIVEIASPQLTADTQMRGTFEARLQQLISEAARDPRLILFIDEIHTLVRAGAVEGGALDAANLLKPALARGELRCIGATTPSELECFLKADPAFERRFEPFFLEEPSPAQAIEMLTAARPSYEAHHAVQITPQAIEAAVRLSARHLLDRCLPDKAFDLLDSACAQVRLPEPPEQPAVERIVNADSVAQALAFRLGIPLSHITDDPQTRLAGLGEFLGKRIIGQPCALQRIVAALNRAYSGLATGTTGDHPLHVFAFFGGSGVGKTATARAIAEFLYGTPEALLRLDMGNYKETHAVARLFGAPPGYIGYSDEGSFASRLRRQPFSLVLLDEIEKAHPEVQDAFLPILGEGRFTDAHGRQVDARQALFILTSNLFSVEAIADPTEYESHTEVLRQRLAGFLRPELISRLDDIVLFGNLSLSHLAQIAANELNELNERLAPYRVSLRASPEAAGWLAEMSQDPNSGARAVLRQVARQVQEPLSAWLLSGQIKAGSQVTLVVTGDRLELRMIPE